MYKSKFSRGFAAAVLMAFASMAIAGSNDNDKGGNASVGNVSNTAAGGLGGAGGAGGHGGTGVGVGVGIAAGGDAKATGGNATGGSVLGSGNSSNRNDNKATGGNASNDGVRVDIGGDRYEAARIPVATAYAAGLTATNGTCFGSASGGLQGPGFGVTLGSTVFDDNCDRRYDSQELRALGQADAALALMCQKASIAEAMKSSSKPCPTAKASAPVATSANYGDSTTAKYEHTDPIVRKRLGLPPLK